MIRIPYSGCPAGRLSAFVWSMESILVLHAVMLAASRALISPPSHMLLIEERGL